MKRKFNPNRFKKSHLLSDESLKSIKGGKRGNDDKSSDDKTAKSGALPPQI